MVWIFVEKVGMFIDETILMSIIFSLIFMISNNKTLRYFLTC